MRNMFRPGLLALAGLFSGLAKSLQNAGGVLRDHGASVDAEMRRAKRRRKAALRAKVKAKFAQLRSYTDGVGMPHGSSGDKLRRKAMRGSVGLPGRRSPLLSWAAGRAGKRARTARSKRSD